jgi:DNA-binding CsgD family transcriptional regulator
MNPFRKWLMGMIMLMHSFSLCKAQEITSHRIEFPGSPNKVIKQMARDDEGFIWFCTNEGIWRYDGNNIKLLDQDKIFESIHSGSNGYILKKSPPLKILEAITEVFDGGAPMTPSVASKTLKLFRQSGTVPVKDEKNPLNSRQEEILNYIVSGMSYKLIADKLFISIETVRYHVKNIYQALHVHSRFELILKRKK